MEERLRGEPEAGQVALEVEGLLAQPRVPALQQLRVEAAILHAEVDGELAGQVAQQPARFAAAMQEVVVVEQPGELTRHLEELLVLRPVDVCTPCHGPTLPDPRWPAPAPAGQGVSRRARRPIDSRTGLVVSSAGMTPPREAITATFPVHSFDADAFGHLAPAALAGYLQEAAGRSADSLGFGVAALNRLGATWVLARQRVVLDQPIRWGDTLAIETWPAGLDRLAALRDFVLRRDGVEIGRALTTWFALDVATRRPVRPDRILPERLHAQPAHVLPAAEPPLPQLTTPELERRFQVRFADIDANQHVTNSSYVAWALEAVEEACWRDQRLVALDVQFLAECHRGSSVCSRSSSQGDGTRLHAIVREEDGKELARARTTWVARG